MDDNTTSTNNHTQTSENSENQSQYTPVHIEYPIYSPNTYVPTPSAPPLPMYDPNISEQIPSSQQSYPSAHANVSLSPSSNRSFHWRETASSDEDNSRVRRTRRRFRLKIPKTNERRIVARAGHGVTTCLRVNAHNICCMGGKVLPIMDINHYKISYTGHTLIQEIINPVDIENYCRRAEDYIDSAFQDLLKIVKMRRTFMNLLAIGFIFLIVILSALEKATAYLPFILLILFSLITLAFNSRVRDKVSKVEEALKSYVKNTKQEFLQLGVDVKAGVYGLYIEFKYNL